MNVNSLSVRIHDYCFYTVILFCYYVLFVWLCSNHHNL
jgi:hypothetical protein